MKEYIDTNLKPSTKNSNDLSQDSYEPALSIDEILSHLELAKVEYEDAMITVLKFILNGRQNRAF